MEYLLCLCLFNLFRGKFLKKKRDSVLLRESLSSGILMHNCIHSFSLQRGTPNQLLFCNETLKIDFFEKECREVGVMQGILVNNLSFKI